jgi:phosphohistidine phosphatase
MKYLTVIRHAKAEDPMGYASDLERPLAERGQKDARQTARALSNLEPAVDWWISSPSLRTRETTQILTEYLNYTNHIIWEATAYAAEADTLLDILREQPHEAEHIVLVGHNPGLEELIVGLCAGSSRHLNLRMPTAALAHLELQIFRWDQIRWGCGQLRLLVAPKILKK